MQIEHIAMYVNDLEKTKDFFVNFLGGKSNDGYHNERTGFRSYFISFDSGARLEIMNKPVMSDKNKDLNRTGYAHVAFSTGIKERENYNIGSGEGRVPYCPPEKEEAILDAFKHFNLI